MSYSCDGRSRRLASEDEDVSTSTAKIVEVTVNKRTQNTRPGIKLYRASNGAIRIAYIYRFGLFHDTALKVGYEVVSINGIACQGCHPKECCESIKKVEGNVTIVARETIYARREASVTTGAVTSLSTAVREEARAEGAANRSVSTNVVDPVTEQREERSRSPQQEATLVAGNETDGEVMVNERGSGRTTHEQVTSSLPTSDPPGGSPVSNPGAFAVRGQTIEQRTLGMLSPLPEEDTEDVEIPIAAEVSSQQGDLEARLREIQTRVQAFDERVQTQVDTRVQEALNRAIPAVTVEPIEERNAAEERGVDLSDSILSFDDPEVLVDDGDDLEDSTADEPSRPSTNNNKKLWERPSFLAVVAVLLVAIVVGTMVGILSSGSSSSPSPPTLPPPTTSPPPSGPTFPLPDGAWLKLGQDLDGEAAGIFLGNSVSLSNDATVLAAGAPFNEANGSNAGHVRVFRRDSAGSIWSQTGQQLKGGATGDQFGISVSLNGAGNIIAAGAWQRGSDGPGYAQAFKYEASTDDWQPLGQQLEGSAAGDRFGASISMSNDGSILAVGAPWNNNSRGHVRIFRYDLSSEMWSLLGNDIKGQAAGDLFGVSVSLNGAGDILAVGADEADAPNGSNPGLVQVFQLLSSSQDWKQLGQDIRGQAAYDDFGNSVSLSNDGMVLGVGAPFNDDGPAGRGGGQVQVFHYSSSVLAWSPLGRPLNGEAADAGFGRSVSLNGAGNVLAAGAPGNHENGSTTGYVGVFQYDTTEAGWMRVGGDIDGEAAGDQSGWSVSLSDSATEVAIGAPSNDGIEVDSGHVRVYALDPN